jgi:hypothetical protein
VHAAEVTREEARSRGDLPADAPRGPSTPLMVTVPDVAPSMLLSAEP